MWRLTITTISTDVEEDIEEDRLALRNDSILTFPLSIEEVGILIEVMICLNVSCHLSPRSSVEGKLALSDNLEAAVVSLKVAEDV
jgi:hypothetical protein